MRGMLTKATAIDFFSGRPALASAVGVSPQAISDWPETLPRRIADRVIAAVIRAGRDVPPEWIEPIAIDVTRIDSAERGHKAA